MGKPVKIIDLAKQMINLSGLSIKTTKNPLGDIEIIYTGLRPGEKLFEELLINAESKPTSNPRIFKAFENSVRFEILEGKIKDLHKKSKDYDIDKSLDILQELVPEWERMNN